MGVLPYIARRLLLSVALVLGVSAVIFSLINAIGHPIEVLLAERPGINAQAVETLSRHYGLDQPALSRYLAWLWGMLRCDLGTSVMHNQPVADMRLEQEVAAKKSAVSAAPDDRRNALQQEVRDAQEALVGIAFELECATIKSARPGDTHGPASGRPTSRETSGRNHNVLRDE